MSIGNVEEVPHETGEVGASGVAGESGRPAATGWSTTVRTVAFGAGAAALIGMASAFGPAAATVFADQPDVVLASPFCNTTCCVEDPEPPQG
ncbi:hypothetical protein ACN27G_07980 [Plantactinospora sp. WMMB334]|uniref:hypothetical protein n=1 Tax=Plantactinospora sp. WMMB334 TaxID=3404119 RepID=UPI003B964B3D